MSTAGPPSYPPAPKLIVSARYAFISERRAQELGVDIRLLRRPRVKGNHVLLDLGRFEIVEQSWTQRQTTLDEALRSITANARQAQLNRDAVDVELALRITLGAGDDHYGVALPTEFLSDWVALGGFIHLDT